MQELIRESQMMLRTYQSDHGCLKKMIDGETNEKKKRELISEYRRIGSEIVNLRMKIMELEHSARMTTFDPNGLRQFARSVAAHTIETQKAINNYTDSVKSAQCLASRIFSAWNLIASILAKI